MFPLIKTSAIFLVGFILADGQELVRKCSDGNCSELTIEKGAVVYHSSGPTAERTIGPYLSQDQHLVPATDAPVEDKRSSEGWRAIATVSLESYDFIGPMYHFRIFDPGGKMRGNLKGDYFLHQLRIGHLLDNETEILAIETQGPHAYTVTASLFLLPVAGEPKVLLTENAQLNKFQSTSESREPGVWLNVETYDGIHSETKGWKPRFWRWNPAQKTLAP